MSLSVVRPTGYVTQKTVGQRDQFLKHGAPNAIYFTGTDNSGDKTSLAERLKNRLDNKYPTQEDEAWDWTDGFFDDLKKAWGENPGFWKAAKIIDNLSDQMASVMMIIAFEIGPQFIEYMNAEGVSAVEAFLTIDLEAPLTDFLIKPIKFEMADNARVALEKGDFITRSTYYSALTTRLQYAKNSKKYQQLDIQAFNHIHGQWISRLVYFMASIRQEEGLLNIARIQQKNLNSELRKTIPPEGWIDILTRIATELPQDKQLTAVEAVLEMFSFSDKPIIPPEKALLFLQEQYLLRAEDTKARQRIIGWINQLKPQFPISGWQAIERWFRQQGRTAEGGHEIQPKKLQLEQAFKEARITSDLTGSDTYHVVSEYLSEVASDNTNPVYVLFMPPGLDQSPLERTIQVYAHSQQKSVSTWTPAYIAEGKSEWKKTKEFTQSLIALSEQNAVFVVDLPAEYPKSGSILSTIAAHVETPKFLRGGLPVDLSRVSFIVKLHGSPKTFTQALITHAQQAGTDVSALEGYNSVLSRANFGRQVKKPGAQN